MFTAMVIISLEYTGLRKRPASALHAQQEAREDIPLRIWSLSWRGQRVGEKEAQKDRILESWTIIKGAHGNDN